MRARQWAEEGGRLVERIMFWQEFLPLSLPLVNRLADQLAAVTAQCESHIDRADEIKSSA